MTQYFRTREEFGLPDLAKTVSIKLLTTASYSDPVMKESIDATGQTEVLYKVAVQIAMVGWAHQVYGKVSIEDEEREITDIFDECGVKYDNESGASLKIEDITPKRLVRFFRHEISAYIALERTPSFLSRKYADRKSRAHNRYLFPCAEYIEMPLDAAEALLSTYGKMDQRLGTSFKERAERVLTAVIGIDA